LRRAVEGADKRFDDVRVIAHVDAGQIPAQRGCDRTFTFRQRRRGGKACRS